MKQGQQTKRMYAGYNLSRRQNDSSDSPDVNYQGTRSRREEEQKIGKMSFPMDTHADIIQINKRKMRRS